MQPVTEPAPEPFFEIRLRKDSPLPSLVGLCVGYERKLWRADQLAAHAMEWLPEFALNWSERQGLASRNAVAMLRRAAQAVYDSEKYQKRGEFGEILLHAALRQVYGSLPAISKIYYKTAVNDTVKGFDAVHVVQNGADLELWLGETKFYEDVSAAIRDVVKELNDHSQTDYLRNEFMLIANKIDDSWPHAPALRKLLSPNTSLDTVFKRAAFPVLLTYDSSCVGSHDECTEKYLKAFVAELKLHHAKFIASKLPNELRIHLLLLPLHTKKELIAKMNERLASWRKV